MPPTQNVRVAFILTTVAFAIVYKRTSGCTMGSGHPVWDTGAVPTAPPNRGPGTGRAPMSGLSLPHFPSIATFSALWGLGVKPTLPRRFALSSDLVIAAQSLFIGASFLQVPMAISRFLCAQAQEPPFNQRNPIQKA